jgi:hypothetical protein
MHWMWKYCPVAWQR